REGRHPHAQACQAEPGDPARSDVHRRLGQRERDRQLLLGGLVGHDTSAGTGPLSEPARSRAPDHAGWGVIVGLRALSTGSAADWRAWRTILGRCDDSAVLALPGPAVQVTIVGWSGSFPGPQSPASCYLIEAGDFRLVLDLGNGAVGALQQYAGLGDVDAIC